MQLDTLDIAEALRLMRTYHSLKQSALAKMLDIGKSYLSQIENGQKPVSIAILQRYVQVFDIPTSSILFFAENFKTFHVDRKVPTFVKEKVINMMQFAAHSLKTEANPLPEKVTDNKLHELLAEESQPHLLASSTHANTSTSNLKVDEE
jgi:transcriptional regulator with XRE-family HTH domain